MERGSNKREKDKLLRVVLFLSDDEKVKKKIWEKTGKVVGWVNRGK